ncbi:MBL fold metallo-hydrolase [Cupriavidus necator]
MIPAATVSWSFAVGLFQGYKNLRLRNWDPLPLEPASIDAVVLTHAHIDHSGYLPSLCETGSMVTSTAPWVPRSCAASCCRTVPTLKKKTPPMRTTRGSRATGRHCRSTPAPMLTAP